MTPLDLEGPVGRLEALLDEPPDTRGVNAAGLVEVGNRRAVVVFAHPLPTQGGTMHTKVVYQAAKALFASAAWCCASISGAPARAKARATTARASWTTTARRSRSWGVDTRRRRCGQQASHSAGTSG